LASRSIVKTRQPDSQAWGKTRGEKHVVWQWVGFSILILLHSPARGADTADGLYFADPHFTIQGEPNALLAKFLIGAVAGLSCVSNFIPSTRARRPGDRGNSAQIWKSCGGVQRRKGRRSRRKFLAKGELIDETGAVYQGPDEVKLLLTHF
jgi:hypothetical protein